MKWFAIFLLWLLFHVSQNDLRSLEARVDRLEAIKGGH
jgi:hypothetical protein